MTAQRTKFLVAPILSIAILDAFLAKRFEAWFKRPIGQAAYRNEQGVDPEFVD